MPAKQRKIAVMGSRSVGKSSLAIQFVQGQFVDSYDPTIENTFNKNLKYKGQEYDVLVVDTAGQDEYSIFPTQYSVDIDGYILVYSIDSEQSFEVVQVIYDKLIDLVGNPNVPLVLVGNKNDLHNDRRVTQDSGRKLAVEMKVVFLETSAKDHQCASDIFIKSLMQIEKAEGGTGDEKKGCSIC
uniref:GTP-binding protein Rheb-like isoform X1 n=1 Tax=Centropages dorsispinatus TaxID=1239308 RepID=A0A0U2UGV0_9MAXI|nr:GTP-binding protein Rheb-like isoform X1 [Centropages dorsispinatus]